MPKETNTQPKGTVKAGALMCPVCCVEYIELEVDFEYDGTILENVKVLRCPSCEEELFSPEQQETITARLNAATQSSKQKPWRIQKNLYPVCTETWAEPFVELKRLLRNKRK